MHIFAVHTFLHSLQSISTSQKFPDQRVFHQTITPHRIPDIVSEMQFDLSITLVALLGFLSAVDAFPAPRSEACTTYPQCIPDGPGP